MPRYRATERGPNSVDQVLQYRRDLVHRLFGFDRRKPIAAALLAVQEPLGVVVNLGQGSALGAAVALEQGIVGIAGDLGEPAVGDRRQHPAVGRADTADAWVGWWSTWSWLSSLLILMYRRFANLSRTGKYHALMVFGTERRDVQDAAGDTAKPRQRGRPRQITRERIVSAARTLAPEQLTMQAVADVLGVDPKALNYHVGDRETLRELVAVDAFTVELSRMEIPTRRRLARRSARLRGRPARSPRRSGRAGDLFPAARQ